MVMECRGKVFEFQDHKIVVTVVIVVDSVCLSSNPKSICEAHLRGDRLKFLFCSFIVKLVYWVNVSESSGTGSTGFSWIMRY